MQIYNLLDNRCKTYIIITAVPANEVRPDSGKEGYNVGIDTFQNEVKGAV
jgi:hypothetical protein